MSQVDVPSITEYVVEGANARLTSSSLTQYVVEGVIRPVTVSSIVAYVVQGPSTEPVEASQVTMYVVEGPTLTGIPYTTPDRNATELNPYRPYIPTEVRDLHTVLFDFMKEQVETLRRQHNLTQSGDTTYPWEVLTELNDSRLYTLGSMGRFFHPTWGLIVARYVQFGPVVEVADDRIAGPVGRLRTSTEVDWIVTNDFSLSGEDLVAGIIFPYTYPVEGQFGWAVTQGANLVSLTPEQIFITYGQNQSYVWSGSGLISATGAGRIIGRRWNEGSSAALEPGEFFVELEGPSSASVRTYFDEDFAEIANEIAALVARIAVVETALDTADLSATIAALQTSITTLQTRIVREETRRAQVDSLLLSRIEAIADPSTAIATVRAELTAIILANYNALDVRVTIAQAKADAAYLLASAIDVTTIQATLDGLNYALGQLDQRVQDLENGVRAVMPLVVGDVPPTLMYFDSGELVRVSILDD